VILNFYFTISEAGTILTTYLAKGQISA